MISCLGAPGTWFLASSQGYAWTSVLTHVLPGQVCPRSLVRSKGICKGETILRIKRVDVNQRDMEKSAGAGVGQLSVASPLLIRLASRS